MYNTKIGLVREGKIPVDNRVPLTPAQAAKVKSLYPGSEIVCQTSNIRAFKDQEYAEHGIDVVEDLSDCDILLGIKEVPVEELIDHKTYLFFSHTVKQQLYNRDLLRQVLEKNIRLIDYERLVDEEERRVIAFGRYAGIVGAYNGIYTYGQKMGIYDLKRARDVASYQELKNEYSKVKVPPIKIILTGSGRVANGALEVLEDLGIRKVTPDDFLQQEFNEPVYAQLYSQDYNRHKKRKEFDLTHYYQHPEQYESTFEPYLYKTDILISGAFWDPKAPVLFTHEQMQRPEFNIKVIADITCDIEGSIPSTIKASTIDEPVYDYFPADGTVADAFSGKDSISVMAIDNLPSELPRDASHDFGEALLEHILPALIEHKNPNMIDRATITLDGSLTATYSYLHQYAYGQ